LVIPTIFILPLPMSRDFCFSSLWSDSLGRNNSRESFFQVYIGRFASYCLTTDDEFKDFFLEYFKGNGKTNKINWEVWIHQPGMPPEIPKLDKTLAQASQELAVLWIAVDREEQIPAPSSNHMKSWSSLQKTCFLDELCTLSQEEPLKVSTLKDMSDLYNFQSSRNSEILFRYCILAIAAEDKSAVPIIVRFITTQGRMKYVRPLYRALHNSAMGRELALSTFLKHQEFYHPICAKMIASDLSGVNQASTQEGSSSRLTKVICGGLVAATIGFIFWRRRTR
jgi:leukotriene-A4 hydrolase